VEQLTGSTCETRDTLSDDDLLGKEGVLTRLLTSTGLRLSPAVRNKTGIWSLAPITPGSAAANAIVRAAADILNEKPSKERLDSLSQHVGRLFERGEIYDMRVALWETVGAMGSDLPTMRWREPWESQEWLPPGIDLGFRLGSLQKNLRAYVLLHTGAEPEAKKMLSPHKVLQLKELVLNPEKVYESLKVLSRWKHFDIDPRLTALCLTKIWLS